MAMLRRVAVGLKREPARLPCGREEVELVAYGPLRRAAKRSVEAVVVGAGLQTQRPVQVRRLGVEKIPVARLQRQTLETGLRGGQV